MSARIGFRNKRLPTIMPMTWIRRILACAALIMVLVLPHLAFGQASTYPPLGRSNFTEVDGSTCGASGPSCIKRLGDRQNSWDWSMELFNNKLYVGTNRAFACYQQAVLHT